MLAPVRTADPPALLSLDEAKDHLRIDLAVTDDDQRIQALEQGFAAVKADVEKLKRATARRKK